MSKVDKETIVSYFRWKNIACVIVATNAVKVMPQGKNHKTKTCQSNKPKS